MTWSNPTHFDPENGDSLSREILVSTYKTTWCDIPEDLSLSGNEYLKTLILSLSSHKSDQYNLYGHCCLLLQWYHSSSISVASRIFNYLDAAFPVLIHFIFIVRWTQDVPHLRGNKVLFSCWTVWWQWWWKHLSFYYLLLGLLVCNKASSRIKTGTLNLITECSLGYTFAVNFVSKDSSLKL